MVSSNNHCSRRARWAIDTGTGFSDSAFYLHDILATQAQYVFARNFCFLSR